ncbi:MAG TPA: ATP-binding protein [Rugosibacter sp.]|nr:ATP-binding protein [Rugosibacter sp.]
MSDIKLFRLVKGQAAELRGDASDLENLITETVIKHPDRAEATRVENFPYAAIEEAVVNAVYHRGYDTREPIEIRLERDEMMIISYPGPDRSVRLDQLQAGRAQPRRYRNRRIGEFLKELEFTEGRCTGIPKIIEAMTKNGSPPAEFEFDEDHSYLMVRLPIHPAAQAVAESATGEVTPPAGSESRYVWRQRPEWRPESVHDRVMAAICDAPKGRAEIATVLSHKSITGALRQAIGDLMAAGLVEYTLPEKPNSRLQKYRSRRH